MKRSFRIRIALLMTVICGTVLLAFNMATWRAMQRTSLRRIDQSIRELGDRYLSVPRGPNYWERVAESLEFVLGDLSGNPFIMLVRGRDGETLHVSGNWPDELDKTTFPTPVQVGFNEAPPPWLPMDRGRGRRGGGGGGGPFGPGRRFQGDGPLGQPGPGDPPPRFEDEPPSGAPQGPPPGPPPAMPIRPGDFYFQPTAGQMWRIGVMSNAEATFVLGLNLAPYKAEMDRFARLFLTAGPAALLLIALGGWWLAQRALRPVQTLTDAAETITAQGLDRRISGKGVDAEFDRLIQVFNGMMDRLERSFKQAVRFSADAAHELKTPLTILQGELAEAVQGAEPGSEHQQRMSRLLEEVQRLKSITRKLLLLSLADSGQLKPQTEPVDISELVQETVEDLQILAGDLRLELAVQPGIVIEGDADLLRQAIQNLAGNSVKYNEPGGKISVELKTTGNQVKLVFGNSGPGVPAEDTERVFERFYRADKARNRRVDGAGLGLSLAREIVRAHHGQLTLEKSQPGWTSFLVTLPFG